MAEVVGGESVCIAAVSGWLVRGLERARGVGDRNYAGAFIQMEIASYPASMIGWRRENGL